MKELEELKGKKNDNDTDDIDDELMYGLSAPARKYLLHATA